MTTRNRAATASIRGYLYQTVLAAQAWLALGQDETLVVEGDEDFDRILAGEEVSTQVKDRAEPIVSLETESLRRSLKAFAEIFADKDGKVRFAYVTTQSRRPPRGQVDHVGNWFAGRDLDGVAAELGRIAKKRRWKVAGKLVDWLAFVQSVQFEFDRGGVQEARQELERLLQHDPRTSAISDVGALAQRLLDNLWTGSSSDDEALRRRTPKDLSSLVDKASSTLVTWARGPAAQRLVGWFEAVEHLEEILSDGTRALTNPERPSQLLDARYEVIPFLFEARRGVIEEFEKWFDTEPRIDVRVVVGLGGAGKTRLFMELCKRRRSFGWHAGFLKTDTTLDDLKKLPKGLGPRLVVIDYAETRLEATKTALRVLDEGGERCRVVLLARETGPWMSSLERGHLERELVSGSLRLEALDLDEEARKVAFHDMVEAFSDARGVEAPATLPKLDLGHPALGVALFLSMAALEASRGADEIQLDEANLLDTTLDHERDYWDKWLRGRGLADDDGLALHAVEQAVAAVTLLGVFESREQAKAALQRTFGQDADLAPGEAASLLGNLYRDEESFARGLQPDRLGEQLVLQVSNALASRLESWVQGLLEGCSETAVQNSFVVLGRIGSRLGPGEESRSTIASAVRFALKGAGDRVLPAYEAAKALGSETALAPIAEILSECIEEGFDPHPVDAVDSMLQDFDGPTDVPPVSLRRLAVTCGIDRVSRRRGGDKESLASALNNLGADLSALGDREGALRATQEAVEIWRELAAMRPDAFRPDLASSINNLGEHLSSLGDRESALRATQEAVEIYRELAATRPDAFRPDLASSINNLGIRWSDLGDREGALRATQEAVEIRRELAATRPDAFRPDLATSLNNLGNRWSDLGDRESALRATQEAVEIRRELAATRPDAFRPTLAGSLNNLGIMWSALDDHDSALAATQEAVEIYRELAATRPDAFRPDLAKSLNNLGIGLSVLGDRETALVATREAVEIRRELAATRPDAFRPDLAQSISVLGDVQLSMNDAEPAVASYREALDLLLPFCAKHPEAFRGLTIQTAKDLVRAAEAAGIEPDADLLDRIREIYGDDALSPDEPD